jgi:type IV pilus assembly protein PilA
MQRGLQEAGKRRGRKGVKAERIERKGGSVLKKMRKIANRKGFTLIELMIVIAIVGVLCAIAIFQFQAYHQKSANAAAAADIRNSKTVLEAFFADQHTYPQ